MVHRLGPTGSNFNQQAGPVPTKPATPPHPTSATLQFSEQSNPVTVTETREQLMNELQIEMSLLYSYSNQVVLAYYDLLQAKAKLHDFEIVTPEDKIEKERPKLQKGQFFYVDLVENGIDLKCTPLTILDSIPYNQMLNRLGLALDYLCDFAKVAVPKVQSILKSISDTLPSEGLMAERLLDEYGAKFHFPENARQVFKSEILPREHHHFHISQEERKYFSPSDGYIASSMVKIRTEYFDFAPIPVIQMTEKDRGRFRKVQGI